MHHVNSDVGRGKKATPNNKVFGWLTAATPPRSSHEKGSVRNSRTTSGRRLCKGAHPPKGAPHDKKRTTPSGAVRNTVWRCGGRDRVIPAFRPGVAAAQTPHRQPTAPHKPVSHDGLLRVDRTCGVKTARGGKKRGNGVLVEHNGHNRNTPAPHTPFDRGQTHSLTVPVPDRPPASGAQPAFEAGPPRTGNSST